MILWARRRGPGRPLGPGPCRRALTTGPEDGSVSLESAAVIGAVFLPLFVGIVNVALMFHAQNLAEAAAQVGVDAARVYESPSDGAAAARSYINQVSPGIYQTVSVSGGRGGDTVTITVHGTTAGFMGLPLPSVDASASAPVERITQ